jgi:carbon storage regulator
MLVLTRKLGETICIGDSIRLSVVGISRNRVRLSFDAPAIYRIERSELRGRREAAPPVSATPPAAEWSPSGSVAERS